MDGGPMTAMTEQTDYIKQGDLVWIASSGFAPAILPVDWKKIATKGIVLEAMPSPNRYWYKILQTTPLGKSEIKQYPLEMLIKIEEDYE